MPYHNGATLVYEPYNEMIIISNAIYLKHYLHLQENISYLIDTHLIFMSGPMAQQLFWFTAIEFQLCHMCQNFYGNDEMDCAIFSLIRVGLCIHHTQSRCLDVELQTSAPYTVPYPNSWNNATVNPTPKRSNSEGFSDLNNKHKHTINTVKQWQKLSISKVPDSSKRNVPRRRKAPADCYPGCTRRTVKEWDVVRARQC